MTAETIREDAATTSDDILPEADNPTVAASRPIRSPGALATQEQLDGLANLLAWFEEKNGPIPDEIQQQFDADLAAADAKIGRVR